VRIKPNEVHLNDPDNYEKIYNVGSRYSKDPPFYRAFGADASIFSTTSNHLHRIRRAALNPLFSRKRVLELEDLVHEKAGKLDARLRRAAGRQESVDLHHGLRAVSVDVITDYAFDSCYCLLDREDLGLEHFDMIRQLGPAICFFQFWPWLQAVAKSMPVWLAGKLNSNLKGLLKMQSVYIALSFLSLSSFLILYFFSCFLPSFLSIPPFSKEVNLLFSSR
jgi:Cytochrome P450